MKWAGVLLTTIVSLVGCDEQFAVRQQSDPAMLTAVAALGGILKTSNLQLAIGPSNGCPSVVSGAACQPQTSGGVTASLVYKGCQKAYAAGSWTGSELVGFAAGANCPPLDLTNNSAVRSFGPGTKVIRGDVTTYLQTSAASSSGWDSSVRVGNGMRIIFGTNFPLSGDRTIALDGLNLTATHRGQKFMDQTLSSSSLVVLHTFTQDKIEKGTLIAQDNLARTTATGTIMEPLVFQQGCCLPVAGKISVSLQGSTSGQESYSFQSTCGQVIRIDPNKQVSNLSSSVCY